MALGRLWATKTEGVGLIVHEFPRFATYVILIHQRHRGTDGKNEENVCFSEPMMSPTEVFDVTPTSSSHA